MDIENPRFEEWENRFREVAEDTVRVEQPSTSLDQCQFLLCLYGENGLSTDDEFNMLESIAKTEETQRYKIEKETAYWQDIVLFVP